MMQTYIMSGATSRFTTKYSQSISLDPKKKYEAALLWIDLYNSIPNITELNNAFRKLSGKTPSEFRKSVNS